MALIVPRPIARISTVSGAGHCNLAPSSAFNTVASNPPFVMFSSDGPKGTLPCRRHRSRHRRVLHNRTVLRHHLASEKVFLQMTEVMVDLAGGPEPQGADDKPGANGQPGHG